MDKESLNTKEIKEVDNITETYVRTFYGLLPPKLLRPEKDTKAYVAPGMVNRFREILLNKIAEGCFGNASIQPYKQFSFEEFRYVKEKFKEKINKELSHELVSKFLFTQNSTDTTIDELLQNIEINLMKYQFKSREEVVKIIFSDPTIDIYNKKYFKEALSASINGLNVKNYKLDLLLIDIDHFKLINDTYGHQAGDFILKELAGLLNKMTRKTDIPAKYGGDELTVLLRYEDGEGGIGFAKKLLSSIKKPFLYKEQEIKFTLSTGIAKFEQDTPESLIEKADKALYKVKNRGRNGINVYGCDEIIRV